MPLINNQNSQTTESNQTQTVQTQPNENKGLISLPSSLMQIVPYLPFALEAMTGQKIPPMGGTIGEIQSSLVQIQFNLNQVLTNQQQLYSRLENLETNASQQLTNLSQQITSTNNSFKLLATGKRSFVVDQTKRSLELSSQPRISPESPYENE
jgi:hypothetical protein